MGGSIITQHFSGLDEARKWFLAMTAGHETPEPAAGKFSMKIHTVLLALITTLVLPGCAITQPVGINRQALRAGAAQALQTLLAQNAGAAAVNDRAIAVLVFPSVIKAGFLYGGQTGDGVLFRNGMVAGFYNTSAISYGLQAGLQDYGYALFFMNKRALSYLNQSAGFELGAGPSIVVADEGFAKNYTTTTLTQDVYAFVFNQRGLMAGLGITGSKITRLSP